MATTSSIPTTTTVMPVALAATAGADEPAAKRMRIAGDEAPAPPSPVLHLRNLPLDVTEYELRSLFPNQASIIKQLVLKNKGQGFVQFTDVQASSYALNFFPQQRTQFRQKQVYLQYSRRVELDNVPANTAMAMQGMASAGIPTQMPAFSGHSFANAVQPSVLMQTAIAPSRPGSVLHVTISDCFYPISIDLLFTVFQACGTVLKMILLNKAEAQGTTQVLVQYADDIMAEQAKNSLNGKYLFDGAGLLRVQTSKFETLKILYNNEKSRDYTQNLPYGPTAMAPTMPQVAAPIIPYGGPIFHPAAMQPQHAPMIQGGGAAIDPAGTCPVILANKLNEERVTCDALFNLFGVYGDVQRVKILYNKRHTAMIQMSNPQQAQLAIRMLNNVPLYGKPMSLTASSHSVVKLPNPDSEEGMSKNTVSYEKSEFHRFAHPGSKNYQNIYLPSNMLHLSNIADGITEEQLTQLFASHGIVSSFRFFPNSNKMAVVTMATIGEAVDALVALHQYPLTPEQRLRVSFAKKNN